MEADGDRDAPLVQAALEHLAEAEQSLNGSLLAEEEQAAEQLVTKARGAVEDYLRQHGTELLAELQPEATQIPDRWATLVEAVTELSTDYGRISTQAGRVLSARGGSPLSVPPDPFTTTLAELRRTPTPAPPLPGRSSGVMGTTGMIANPDQLTPGGPAKFIKDERRPPNGTPPIQVLG